MKARIRRWLPRYHRLNSLEWDLRQAWKSSLCLTAVMARETLVHLPFKFPVTHPYWQLWCSWRQHDVTVHIWFYKSSEPYWVPVLYHAVRRPWGYEVDLYTFLLLRALSTIWGPRKPSRAPEATLKDREELAIYGQAGKPKEGRSPDRLDLCREMQTGSVNRSWGSRQYFRFGGPAALNSATVGWKQL